MAVRLTDGRRVDGEGLDNWPIFRSADAGISSQRNDYEMGLTIHYALEAKARSPRQAVQLMGQLRGKALDLPFKEVGEVVELAGKMKDVLGGDVEAAIMKFQNFEHLEAEGRKDE